MCEYRPVDSKSLNTTYLGGERRSTYPTVIWKLLVTFFIQLQKKKKHDRKTSGERPTKPARSLKP